MSDHPGSNASKPQAAPGTPAVRTRRFNVSLVWLVPIVAALVGLSMVVHNSLSAGPEITISFQTAEGLEANKTQIDFLVEDKKVVFVDDVLFTGRSIRSALTAIQSFGRPSEIELLVLIDRRFSRHLPIQPDYRGRQVDVINNEKVIVNWKQNEGEDEVLLVSKPVTNN